ncbi:MAG: bacterial transcriptional activator domain-containing protein [Saprospiraceae bacterium]
MVDSSIDQILNIKHTASIQVFTLGKFEVYIDNEKVSSKAWKRDKSLQLFQFFILTHHRKAMHKEQIVDKLWHDELDDKSFKVALHGINKVLEPHRKSHADSKYLERNGQTYRLLTEDIWVDSIAFEELVSLAHQYFVDQPEKAIAYYRAALNMHYGPFLPDRIYEDWSAEERERLQLIFLGASMSLAELLLESNPMASIQLCQDALLVDMAWEEAYRIQMAAYFAKGNRPMAIKTYQICERVLWDEMALKPLPETKKLYDKIISV